MSRSSGALRPSLSAPFVTLAKGYFMRIVALGAVAAVFALAACNNSTPAENTADAIEANAENAADVLDEQADNAATDAGEEAIENQADTVRQEGENAADAVREGAEDSNTAGM